MLSQRTDVENDQLVTAWIELSGLFRSKGVELLYHSHGEPGEDIEFVLENLAEDELLLAPDLDWLRVGRSGSGRLPS